MERGDVSSAVKHGGERKKDRSAERISRGDLDLRLHALSYLQDENRENEKEREMERE